MVRLRRSAREAARRSLLVIVLERRASAVLFHVLRALPDPRPFLVPANVCPVVPRTFEAAERPIEVVDIDKRSLAIDPDRCRERVRAGTCAGIVFVRPYGSEVDPTPFFHALRNEQPDLLIVDDRCLCAPDLDGGTISPAADVSLFSTGPRKFTDLGRGGFAHIADRVAYERATNGTTWLDLRPPDTEWAEYRDRATEETRAAEAHKRDLNAIYAAAIPAAVQLPEAMQRWRFNVRVPNAARLVAAIFEHGLFAGRHFQPLGDFPVASRLHAEIVNLFNDRHFTAEQARGAATLVAQHLRAHAA